MRGIKKVILSLLIGIVATELILRFGFGFCNAPLYIEDPDFEYVYAPNQYRLRFRNLVKTNEACMRSNPIATTDTTVILLVGDSVINGGNPTDHNDLATTILENTFKQNYRQPIRVLNVSAGSWGPDNIFAFLKKQGFFNADLICLITSSHDAFDNMSHKSIVGINENYPNKQYTFALYEVWHRYYIYIDAYIIAPIKEFFSPITQHAPDDIIHKFGNTFNKGFQQLADTTRSMGIPFVIYLHPELSEIKQNKYDSQGKMIIDFAHQNKIPLIEELKYKPDSSLFRNPRFDGIHYNATGQRFMATKLYPLLKNYIDVYFNNHARTHRP